MNKKELKRLTDIDRRILEIIKEEGLLTTEVIFEIVPSQKVLEGMAYMFPVNFSHWSFGRDYERHRTIYEHTGGGIPYEQVWNFDVPRAFLVETNPFVLNVMILAHVYAHVDFFLANKYCQHGRSFADIAFEARAAADRFLRYEELYGKRGVEKIIDAGMSICWHQHPDIFIEEQSEEDIKRYLIAKEKAKLESFKNPNAQSEFQSQRQKEEEIKKTKEKIKALSKKTPPEPVYDILKYIIEHSPRPLESWEKDILTVIRDQSRCLMPNGRTKMLNEGWATYWHVNIMRRLFQENLLNKEEHDVFNYFHSRVARKSKSRFNWYNIGLALYKNIEERWNKGQFGREYETETDFYKLAHWDTKAGLGSKKIFKVREAYSDRMAIEEFFTDDFIHDHELYVYVEDVDRNTGDIVYVVAKKDPKFVKAVLKSMTAGRSIPVITVEDGDFANGRRLLLKHHWTGFELDESYRDGALRHIFSIWGRPIYLTTYKGNDEIVVFCQGKNIEVKKVKH